ncbi:hypothetical protein, partial [Hymenobacter agri]
GCRAHGRQQQPKAQQESREAALPRRVCASAAPAGPPQKKGTGFHMQKKECVRKAITSQNRGGTPIRKGTD